MGKVVLDNSAFLAFSLGEPGCERVEAALQGAVVSAVSVTEMLSVLVRNGLAPEYAHARVRQFLSEIVPHDEGLAATAASLRPMTLPLGLSSATVVALPLPSAWDSP